MSLKLYDNIDDLPVYNYLKIKNTGDLKYLFVSNIDETIYKSIDLSKVWGDIQFQIAELNGITEDQEIIYNRKKELLILKTQMLTEFNEGLIPDIQKKERELNNIMQMYSKGASMTLLEVICNLEIELKFQIDIYKTSVSRFYTYLKILRNGANKKR